MTLKTKKAIRLAFLFACLASPFLSVAQDAILEKLAAGFTRYLNEEPQEKIYMHMDRSYYTSGETIWLKAYLTAGVDHIPSPLSRALYVELIKDTQVVHAAKLLVTNGTASGSLSLSDKIASGTYVLRAYTNWMRNVGEEYFFHRTILIGNTSETRSASNLDQQVSLQFFPEGGELVNGIGSRFAFKAIGTDGRSRVVKGKIIDEARQVVAEFKTNGLGMGSVYLTPQKGKSYTAIIESTNTEAELPPARESGLTLAVTHSPKTQDLVIRMQTNEVKANNFVYVVAHTRGRIGYTARVALTTNFAIAKIPKSNFPSGITQITVADQQGMPLAERLVFIDQHDNISVEIKSDKPSYKPRELVTLDITTKDKNGTPIATDLSLAVWDAQLLERDKNQQTIGSYLLLSSDLKGYIESPGYYFNEENTDRYEALDLLLLTQGWRRFSVREAMSEPKAPLHKVEQGLPITGKLTDERGRPIAEGKVSYLAVNPSPQMKTAATDVNGNFILSDNIYFDSTQVMLQGETKKGNKAVKIEFNRSSEIPATTAAMAFAIEGKPVGETEFLTQSIERKKIDAAYNFDEKVITLDEVEVRGRAENTDPSATSTSFGNGTVTIKPSDFPSSKNAIHPLQLLQGRVAGLTVRGSGQDWTVTMRGVGSINSNSTPLILVNDAQVSLATLYTISPEEIESISVWKGPDAAIFGARGANGAIGFYLKKGDVPIQSGNTTITFPGRGFHVDREFYAPRYDVKKPEHVKPDRRVTLLWQPWLTTDSTGRTTVSFYNHDLETTITGVAEGISQKGTCGTGVFSYSIVR